MKRYYFSKEKLAERLRECGCSEEDIKISMETYANEFDGKEVTPYTNKYDGSLISNDKEYSVNLSCCVMVEQ